MRLINLHNKKEKLDRGRLFIAAISTNIKYNFKWVKIWLFNCCGVLIHSNKIVWDDVVNKKQSVIHEKACF